MELRYLGFDQQRNTRAYRFDGLTKGEPTVHFVVTADLAMFLKRRIGIQEGPSLCAHKLASETPTDGQSNVELTDDDLRAAADARAAADSRKAELRRNAPRRRPTA